MCLHRALYVLHRHDEMQVGLTAMEKQQLEGVSFEQLLAAIKKANFSFSRGLSAHRGVTYVKSRQQYLARIRIGEQQKTLGCFKLEEDAAVAYDKAAIAAFGRYTRQYPFHLHMTYVVGCTHGVLYSELPMH